MRNQVLPHGSAHLAKRISTRHMTKNHRHELRPAGESLGAAVSAVASDDLLELRSGKMRQQSTQQTRYSYHRHGPPPACAENDLGNHSLRRIGPGGPHAKAILGKSK